MCNHVYYVTKIEEGTLNSEFGINILEVFCPHCDHALHYSNDYEKDPYKMYDGYYEDQYDMVIMFLKPWHDLNQIISYEELKERILNPDPTKDYKGILIKTNLDKKFSQEKKEQNMIILAASLFIGTLVSVITTPLVTAIFLVLFATVTLVGIPLTWKYVGMDSEVLDPDHY